MAEYKIINAGWDQSTTQENRVPVKPSRGELRKLDSQMQAKVMSERVTFYLSFLAKAIQGKSINDIVVISTMLYWELKNQRTSLMRKTLQELEGKFNEKLQEKLQEKLDIFSILSSKKGKKIERNVLKNQIQDIFISGVQNLGENKQYDFHVFTQGISHGRGYGYVHENFYVTRSILKQFYTFLGGNPNELERQAREKIVLGGWEPKIQLN